MASLRLLASTLLVPLSACGGGGGFPDAPGIDAAQKGTFSVQWTVVDTNNQPLSCDRIAAQSMTALVHNKAFMGGSTEIFTCPTGAGQSQQVITGTYEIDFELSGTFGLYATAPKQDNVEITADQNTPLMPLVFQVDAKGALELTVSTGNASGNCAGGTGIETMSITLQHNRDQACEPVTLNIAAGANSTARTYTVNCAAPVDAPCIQNDQKITAMGVSSDEYTIRVRGKIGGTACWNNNDTIQVPPLGKTLTRTLNLAKASTPGC